MELQLEKKGVPTDRHNLMEIKYLKRRDGEIKTANLKYLIVEKKISYNHKREISSFFYTG